MNILFEKLSFRIEDLIAKFLQDNEMLQFIQYE